MIIKEYKYINKDGDEVTQIIYQELVCPNLREHYLKTRGCSDLKAEHDLLTCHILTDDEYFLIKSKLPLSQTIRYPLFNIFCFSVNFLSKVFKKLCSLCF